MTHEDVVVEICVLEDEIEKGKTKKDGIYRKWEKEKKRTEESMMSVHESIRGRGRTRRRESDAQLNSRGFDRCCRKRHSPPREESTREESEVERWDADNVLGEDDQTVSLRDSSNAGTARGARSILARRRTGGDTDLTREEFSKGA